MQRQVIFRDDLMVNKTEGTEAIFLDESRGEMRRILCDSSKRNFFVADLRIPWVSFNGKNFALSSYTPQFLQTIYHVALYL